MRLVVLISKSIYKDTAREILYDYQINFVLMRLHYFNVLFKMITFV